MGIISAISVAVIIILLSGGTLGLEMLLPSTPTPTPYSSPSPSPVPSPAPNTHIYGGSPLVILDASEFNDSGYISQAAAQFGELNDFEGEYHKVSPNAFLETYKQMSESGNTPNLIIAPNNLLVQLGNFEDVSRINGEVLFNNASKGAIRDDRIPIALKMYGYFFRADLLFAMSHDVPREYNELERLGERLRSDYAYDYLRYTEDNELLAERADEFLTSRYGFGFPGGDVGGQLFIEQAIPHTFEDGTNILYEIQTMWDEIYLPPDTVYASDDVIEQAYMNDALAGVFSAGTLYERLFENGYLYASTQIKPYLGQTPVFTACVIYCAVPEGSDAEVATNFLSILYNGGNLDKIIAQNHTAYLPISNFLNQGSPWKNALNEDSEIIYFEDDYYIQVLKKIILGAQDVETALANSQR